MLKRGWFGNSGLWKPKNPHSLEHLKHLHTVLMKNSAVTEGNRNLLVECLRAISEILIWGDQNDSTVFDFFLEKNMLSYFLKIMRQKGGRHICVQLLQTLNILFENISNETSLYYLLSNNLVNNIIMHKFDFSDEEVLAYYISFLKTLSFKLNRHTIHFFYNEHTNDFPLYTEAITFFNHSESMVRIAVRTLSLNVYKVDNGSMLRFIQNKTSSPYFSNLVWFIGNHVLELDSCVRNDVDHQNRRGLSDLVAEHLDHLHYLNDIFQCGVDSLNSVLTDHLLNRLLIPLYVYSLNTSLSPIVTKAEDDVPKVNSVVALYLLSQVFLILTHPSLVRQLACIIFNGEKRLVRGLASEQPGAAIYPTTPGFVPPIEPLELSLGVRSRVDSAGDAVAELDSAEIGENGEDVNHSVEPESRHNGTAEGEEVLNEEDVAVILSSNNITDEEKISAANAALVHGSADSNVSNSPAIVLQIQDDFSLANRPFLAAIFDALDCSTSDHMTLVALVLLYAMGHNNGINQDLLDQILLPTSKSKNKYLYNASLLERIIKVISQACQYGSKIRLATLEMCCLMVKLMVHSPQGPCYIQDRHLAVLEASKEESTLILRSYYKGGAEENLFLDMFEDEYVKMKNRPLNVEYLTMDASILLYPTGTPLTGIEFTKRLPCGEAEKTRKAIHVFFLMRDLSLTLRHEDENDLPLSKQDTCIHIDEVLNLNNSDMIACTVVDGDGQKSRRFLVIDICQMILVEPDVKGRLGYGIAKFVGNLQDIEVCGDKDDTRCLHITVHKPASGVSTSTTPGPSIKTPPLLQANFIFDDHIRCTAAKMRLSKGRLKARQSKLMLIAKLLDIPTHISHSAGLYTPSYRGAAPGVAVPASSSAHRHIHHHHYHHHQQQQQQRLHQRQRGTGQEASPSSPAGTPPTSGLRPSLQSIKISPRSSLASACSAGGVGKGKPRPLSAVVSTRASRRGEGGEQQVDAAGSSHTDEMIPLEDMSRATTTTAARSKRVSARTMSCGDGGHSSSSVEGKSRHSSQPSMFGWMFSSSPPTSIQPAHLKTSLLRKERSASLSPHRHHHHHTAPVVTYDREGEGVVTTTPHSHQHHHPDRSRQHKLRTHSQPHDLPQLLNRSKAMLQQATKNKQEPQQQHEELSSVAPSTLKQTMSETSFTDGDDVSAIDNGASGSSREHPPGTVHTV